jgi:hypothetical protein
MECGAAALLTATITLGFEFLGGFFTASMMRGVMSSFILSYLPLPSLELLVCARID